MFPGFVYLYKDEDSYLHLFFFKGIDDNLKPIYRDLDLSKIPFKFSINNLDEDTIDYKFENKSIVKITCNLVPNDLVNNTIQQKILTLRK